MELCWFHSRVRHLVMQNKVQASFCYQNARTNFVLRNYGTEQIKAACSRWKKKNENPTWKKGNEKIHILYKLTAYISHCTCTLHCGTTGYPLTRGSQRKSSLFEIFSTKQEVRERLHYIRTVWDGTPFSSMKASLGRCVPPAFTLASGRVSLLIFCILRGSPYSNIYILA